MKPSANNIQIVKQKLVIIGDSHARKSAAELQINIGSTFTVSSFIKPGAGMGSIVDTMKDDIKTLNSDDVVIIWGWSNDIGKNNSKEALKHLCDFIKNNQKVNIVVMTAPPRHYLLPSSCVNSEVLSYNKQLRKRMKQYNNVKILETDLERKYFTKHGLHLNSSGKECITLKLATVIKSFFLTERMSLIYLHWKDDTVITKQDKINKDSSVINNNDKSTPQSQSHSPIETSANDKAIDSGPNIRDGRNDSNQESEISKETTGINKQDIAIGVNDTTTNINSKESENDSKRNEPQYRTSNRPQKKILVKERVIFYGHNTLRY